MWLQRTVKLHSLKWLPSFSCLYVRMFVDCRNEKDGWPPQVNSYVHTQKECNLQASMQRTSFFRGQSSKHLVEYIIIALKATWWYQTRLVQVEAIKLDTNQHAILNAKVYYSPLNTNGDNTVNYPVIMYAICERVPHAKDQSRVLRIKAECYITPIGYTITD